MYGKLEEDYGLARHAMRVYDRATRSVSDEDRFEVFLILINKDLSSIASYTNLMTYFIFF